MATTWNENMSYKYQGFPVIQSGRLTNSQPSTSHQMPRSSGGDSRRSETKVQKGKSASKVTPIDAFKNIRENIAKSRKLLQNKTGMNFKLTLIKQKFL